MDAVHSSFDRARRAGFTSRFYEGLLSSDPAIRLKFQATDFKRQRELLVHAVYSMLDYAAGKPLGELALRRLCRIHGPDELNIPESMYTAWLACFMRTLAATDPEYDGKLERAWSRALAPGLDYLRGCNKKAGAAK